MSDTRAVTSAPRRLLIGSITGLIGLASAAALVAAPAANASTTTPLPGCVLPAGVTWHLVFVSPAPGRQVFRWAASSNGVTYNGSTNLDLTPTQARADGLFASCSATTS